MRPRRPIAPDHYIAAPSRSRRVGRDRRLRSHVGRAGRANRRIFALEASAYLDGPTSRVAARIDPCTLRHADTLASHLDCAALGSGLYAPCIQFPCCEHVTATHALENDPAVALDQGLCTHDSGLIDYGLAHCVGSGDGHRRLAAVGDDGAVVRHLGIERRSVNLELNQSVAGEIQLDFVTGRHCDGAQVGCYRPGIADLPADQGHEAFLLRVEAGSRFHSH